MGQGKESAESMAVEESGAGAVSVLVHAGEQMTLDAVSAALESVESVSVVARAADLEGVSRYARGHRPGVVLLVAWPGDPVEQTSRVVGVLAEASPESRVLVLGRSTDAEVVRGVLREGANGYVLALQGVDALVEGIELAAQDYAYVSPRLGCEIARIPDAKPDDLTERELEIVSRIAHGQTNAEAAIELALSVRTIESHRRTIYEKLDIGARHELVSYAIEHGLLPLGPAERLAVASRPAAPPLRAGSTPARSVAA